MYKHLLIDLDETLLDFKASEHESVRTVLGAYEFERLDELCVAFSKINLSLWKRLETSEITREQVLQLRFAKTIEWYLNNINPINPLPQNVTASMLNETFLSAISKSGIPIPGAIEAIHSIRSASPNSKISIITNGAIKSATGRLAASGIDKIVDYIYISEAIGYNKPDKRFFDFVLTSLEALPEECLVIGDSLSSDIRGANNSSIDACWFNRMNDINDRGVHYKFEVHDYKELVSVIINDNFNN